MTEFLGFVQPRYGTNSQKLSTWPNLNFGMSFTVLEANCFTPSCQVVTVKNEKGKIFCMCVYELSEVLYTQEIDERY